ncbi:MAG: hypothetical protein ACOC5T_10410 [Elusimicrobiota bacterium]
MVEQKQVDDFRNLKPYYDLVFGVMEAISQHCFNREVLKSARALRELIINTSPYINNAKKRLETIETELEKVITANLNKEESSLTREQRDTRDEAIDEFLKYVQNTRIEILDELEKSGFMPKTFINKERPVNPALKGGDKE